MCERAVLSNKSLPASTDLTLWDIRLAHCECSLQMLMVVINEINESKSIKGCVWPCDCPLFRLCVHLRVVCVCLFICLLVCCTTGSNAGAQDIRWQYITNTIPSTYMCCDMTHLLKVCMQIVFCHLKYVEYYAKICEQYVSGARKHSRSARFLLSSSDCCFVLIFFNAKISKEFFYFVFFLRLPNKNESSENGISNKMKNSAHEKKKNSVKSVFVALWH